MLLIDTSKMQRVGGQIGTNPAGIYQSESGQRYYVKTLESEALARNELIASRLYQLVGAPTLTYVHTKDPCQIATKWVVLEKRCVAHFNEDERKQAKRWFGVHAWTANWDAVGYAGDNQGVVNGLVVTLDVGGALEFRAQGDPKGKAFGYRVDEIEKLRYDDGNYHALKLFSDMSGGELKEAIAVVTKTPSSRIRQLIIDSGGGEKLAHKMVARKEVMEHLALD